MVLTPNVFLAWHFTSFAWNSRETMLLGRLFYHRSHVFFQLKLIKCTPCHGFDAKCLPGLTFHVLCMKFTETMLLGRLFYHRSHVFFQLKLINWYSLPWVWAWHFTSFAWNSRETMLLGWFFYHRSHVLFFNWNWSIDTPCHGFDAKCLPGLTFHVLRMKFTGNHVVRLAFLSSQPCFFSVEIDKVYSLPWFWRQMSSWPDISRPSHEIHRNHVVRLAFLSSQPCFFSVEIDQLILPAMGLTPNVFLAWHFTSFAWNSRETMLLGQFFYHCSHVLFFNWNWSIDTPCHGFDAKCLPGLTFHVLRMKFTGNHVVRPAFLSSQPCFFSVEIDQLILPAMVLTPNVFLAWHFTSLAWNSLETMLLGWFFYHRSHVLSFNWNWSIDTPCHGFDAKCLPGLTFHVPRMRFTGNHVVRPVFLSSQPCDFPVEIDQVILPCPQGGTC